MPAKAPPRSKAPAGLELRPPTFHWSPPRAYTLGESVAKLGDLVGFRPDPEQRLVLDEVFAVNDVGTAAAFEINVGAPRQNLKTGSLILCGLGWLFVVKAPDIVWSAHEYDTAVSSFDKLAEIIETHDFLRRRVKSMPVASGKQAINLVSGASMRFKARTKTGGRGLDGEKLVLDEAFALGAEHIGSLMPLMSTKRDPQIIYASSAEHEDSDVLRSLNKRGKAGGEARFAHLQWCDPRDGDCQVGGCTHHYGRYDGCVMDDVGRWVNANPSLALTPEQAAAGRRITLAYVEGERRSMPPEEFGRERMGWDDASDEAPALAIEAWVDLADTTVRIASDRAIAVDMSPRRDRTSISLAGADPDGKPRVQLIEYGSGEGWQVDRLEAECLAYGLDEVLMVKGSQAESLIPALDERGITARSLTVGEYGIACGTFYGLASQPGSMTHDGRIEANTAVEAARLRDNGESTWVWSRRKSSTDISPLVSHTCAIHGHLTTPEDAVLVSLADLDDEEDGEDGTA